MLKMQVIRQLVPHFRFTNQNGSQCCICSSTSGFLGQLRKHDNGINMHGAWCCSPQCFAEAVRRELSKVVAGCKGSLPTRHHRMPLGLVLLSRGVIDGCQLRNALDSQQSSGEGRLGEWLQKLGYATEAEITRGLSEQWAIPMLRNARLHPAAAYLIPFPILEHYGIVPVHYLESRRRLCLGLSEGVDSTLLYAIEQALGCSVEACVIGASSVRVALEGRKRLADREIVFQIDHSESEMADICCNYALQVHAHEMRMVGCGDYTWARLKHSSGVLDVLFKMPSVSRAL